MTRSSASTSARSETSCAWSIARCCNSPRHHATLRHNLLKTTPAARHCGSRVVDVCVSNLLPSAAWLSSFARLETFIVIARRNLLVGIGICCAFATVRVRAAEPSAKSFVETIYATYKGKDAKGISLDSDAAVRRYFEPRLAALIIK